MELVLFLQSYFNVGSHNSLWDKNGRTKSLEPLLFVYIF
jgi:hypothetical protein